MLSMAIKGPFRPIWTALGHARLLLAHLLEIPLYVRLKRDGNLVAADFPAAWECSAPRRA